MITSAILWLIYIFVSLLLSPIFLLDDVSVNSNFASAIATVNSYLSNINNVFPLNTLLIIIFLILGIELSIATYKLIMWGLKRLPTQS